MRMKYVQISFLARGFPRIILLIRWTARIVVRQLICAKVPLGIHPRPQVIPCLRIRYLHCCHHVKHEDLDQPNLSELHRGQGLCRHPLLRRPVVVRQLYHLLLRPRTQHSCHCQFIKPDQVFW
jgi:hypothetical protein